MTRTALYARYSSDIQSHASIEDQFAICRNQASREGWRIIGTYHDAAISGASVILRPGIQSLLQDAQLGKFDTILAEALDRISRDQADVATLYKHFQFAGVKLVTIAEGEITELHVGLKGTMNALFLKDLAKKTHRGLRGRVEKGKSGGGLCYGYDVLKRVDGNGELIRGERSINEAEALVIHRIFREFSTGKSPRAIATDLNRECIPGPFGKQWSDTTIRGHRARKTGILQNELYVGVLVWNRQKFIKNPSTGKRVSRPNPESEWIRKEVPQLRILTDELWDAARLRMEELSEVFKGVADGIRASKGKRLRNLHRPAFLFSGMIECGVCGGNCTIVVNDRYGCNNHFRKGTCQNGRTIRREILETRALKGISQRLVSADAVKQAVAAYIDQINAANREQRAQAELDRRSLEKIDRSIAGIISAIEDGMYQPSMKARLNDLERQRDELRDKRVEDSQVVPYIHPNVAELYRRRVAYLVKALKDPVLRDEVGQDIRSIVGKIIITPGPERGQVHAELCGQLMGILGVVSKEGGGGGRLYRQGLRPPATNVGITPGFKVIPTGESSPRNQYLQSKQQLKAIVGIGEGPDVPSTTLAHLRSFAICETFRPRLPLQHWRFVMHRHEILGGKVQVYRRIDGGNWHCSASVGGRQHRATTRTDSVSLAKQVAEDWYLGLRGKLHAGILKTEKTFKEASAQFLREYEIITEGQRSKRWTEGHGIRLRVHLLPFFGDLGLSEITGGKVQEYRVHRMSSRGIANPHSKSNRPVSDKAPARKTLHNEIVTLRQVLRTAVSHGWLSHLPEISSPYRASSKVEHRPWFSPAEYKQLYKATGAYAREPFHAHFQWNAQQVHDYVLFMANTGLRPDEASNLEHRDVEIVIDDETGQQILEIEVRGKRGVGFCKSMPNAVRPYERLLNRPRPVQGESRRAAQRRRWAGIDEAPEAPEAQLPKPTDKVFPGNHVKLFNGVLARAELKFDRDGKARTAYSLRHTYICLRLMEGADVYAVARNCRTSVEMIQKHYAAHIKNMISAASVNVRKVKPKRRRQPVPVAFEDDDLNGA